MNLILVGILFGWNEIWDLAGVMWQNFKLACHFTYFRYNLSHLSVVYEISATYEKHLIIFPFPNTENVGMATIIINLSILCQAQLTLFYAQVTVQLHHINQIQLIVPLITIP